MKKLGFYKKAVNKYNDILKQLSTGEQNLNKLVLFETDIHYRNILEVKITTFKVELAKIKCLFKIKQYHRVTEECRSILTKISTLNSKFSLNLKQYILVDNNDNSPNFSKNPYPMNDDLISSVRHDSELKIILLSLYKLNIISEVKLQQQRKMTKSANFNIQQGMNTLINILNQIQSDDLSYIDPKIKSGILSKAHTNTLSMEPFNSMKFYSVPSQKLQSVRRIVKDYDRFLDSPAQSYIIKSNTINDLNISDIVKAKSIQAQKVPSGLQLDNFEKMANSVLILIDDQSSLEKQFSNAQLLG